MNMIPDLRAAPEITLEHCWVLVERVGEALSAMDGFDPKEFNEYAGEINPELLLHVFEDYVKPKAFSHLFATDFGKTILVGMFLQTLLERIKEEEES